MQVKFYENLGDTSDRTKVKPEDSPTHSFMHIASVV